MDHALMTDPAQELEGRFLPLKDYVADELPTGEKRQAAVLIPIVRRSQDQIIYTLRSRHLKKHAGQISFPGGKIEPGESPLDAALREAHEEIGLHPQSVEPIGRIDDVITTQGFHIRCYAAFCDEFEPELNTGEVERLVKVDVNELFDTSLHESKPWGNRNLVHYFHFKDGLVWGATGRITYRLREILKRLS